MDKNTLYGVICMAAIFMGFMYCNRPEQQPVDQAQQEASSPAAPDQALAAPIDSLTPAVEASLAQAVRVLGTADATGHYTLNDDLFSLSLDSTRVHGTVNLPGQSVGIADLRNPASAITPEQRMQAMAAVGDLVATVGKYGGLARNLGGQSKYEVLENDDMKVTFSSRGGLVSAVQLKKYKTEVGENPGDIELFQGDNDGYSFIFTTADQRIDTREFNFTPVVESDTTVLMQLDLANGATWGIRYTLLGKCARYVYKKLARKK